ncbi:outer membrane beta-barrel protein [Alcaligenes phenolicus]|uniref:outer membrane beta-barrel protein n=1 Tax=Betaproteobacteria TaxID=28216 RepID=UPI003D80D97F
MSFSARSEYYQDRNGVIVKADTPNGFKMYGYSINMDYSIRPNWVWRTEFRRFEGGDAVFVRGEETLTPNSSMAVTALAVSF